VVFVEFGEIIVSSTVDPNEGYLPGFSFCKRFAVPDGYQFILGAMDNIGVTINMKDPFICAQMITQNITDGKNRKEAFRRLFENCSKGNPVSGTAAYFLKPLLQQTRFQGFGHRQFI
jgi:hypothetical protein